MFKKFSYFLFFIFFINNISFAEIVKSIKIIGNDRISSETIKLFSEININDDIDSFRLNQSIKNLYETNFFSDLRVNFENNELTIFVVELPIIENYEITGIKSKALLDKITTNLNLKSRASFNESFAKNDIQIIKDNLKNEGYFFSDVDFYVTDEKNNKVDLTIQINLKNKAKIKKISFIGNKIFKDRQLKNVIISEEYKFWKFISGKKYLNENILQLDNRLLKNFYLNKGFYNVQINTSFARLVNDDEFELIFNINASEKLFFNNIDLILPIDFTKDNFANLYDHFNNIKGEPYSLIEMQKIINKIELLALTEEYQNIDVLFNEEVNNAELNITLTIAELEKFSIDKINIFGNNITNENVIRNQLEVDEGDPFSKILFEKSINNIKKLNFFRSVSQEIIDTGDNSKILNIKVEEKPTGEIALGAGFGTSGGTISFSIKENNFLGNGIGLNTSLSLSEEAIKGQINISNPNYKNTDKSVNFNIQAIELDRLTSFGYKSNKVGFGIGTNFEYFEDFNLGVGVENYAEKITADSTASSRQKKQAGNYWDSFLNLDFIYDKRNQKFQTTSGYYSLYSTKLPILSDTGTLTNEYNYKIFTELFENNNTSLGFSLSASNSIINKDIKLSERLYLPSNRLRGFETGKVGPKDGDDFIGGNYSFSANFASTLPQIFENSQNLDVLFFIDAANLWGVDYDATIKNSNSIRSSLGLGVDWLTAVGPLSFSLAYPITKESSDVTETFRFNLGTSF